MQTSISSPQSGTTDEILSLMGRTFIGTISAKKDDCLIIAIAHQDGEEVSIPGILPKDGLIGFTPAIKEQRFALLESGCSLFVRATALDPDSSSASFQLTEVSSIR